MLSKSCVMLFHDSSTRIDKSDEVPLWVDFGKQISLTVHSFQVITTSSKVIIFCMLETKESCFFLKKRVQMEHGWQAPPSPLPTRGNMENCKKKCKSGDSKDLGLIKGSSWVFSCFPCFATDGRRCQDHFWWGLYPFCLPT